MQGAGDPLHTTANHLLLYCLSGAASADPISVAGVLRAVDQTKERGYISLAMISLELPNEANRAER